MSRTISYGPMHSKSNQKVDRYPSFCGICHKNVEPIFIGTNLDNNTIIPNKVEAAFQCANTDCSSIMIGYYTREDPRSEYRLIDSAPLNPVEEDFNKEIVKVSPNFISIYNQSYFAEQSKLELIAGIGYRKALEFLVKDYLIFLNPHQEEEILNKFLGKCIEMVDNEKIKEISRRASWLGNDEAHYIRKWENKDVNDLKKLIEVTVYFISMDISTRSYLEEMQ
ncbi:hypothetical protein GCM10008934_24710 [Virgibacillus salarius]|uniref:hypothetical protein n=1 Tax=Virgibacillus salarius TaxID=447199 RepID=UPI0031DE1C85